MARSCCLAGMDGAVPIFSAVFKAAGEPALATVARLDVLELGRLVPDVLVCDLDDVDVDHSNCCAKFASFCRTVLSPSIAVSWSASGGRACHLAGANCLLAKSSDEQRLSEGLRDALRSGCYTDPGFAA